MKRGNDTHTGAQERTAMKDKNVHRNAQQGGRPNPSQNTINPNRGLNEDEQKRATNQEEEDETTNAYTESSATGKRDKSSEKNSPAGRATEKRHKNR
jgi:hypothetical protein